jgi:hypothetical protein
VHNRGRHATLRCSERPAAPNARHSHRTRGTDRELLKLKVYLCKIAHLPSLRKLKHRRWEAYIADELARLPQSHGGGGGG